MKRKKKCFTEVKTKDFKDKALKLNKNNAPQVSDIPVKDIKDNVDTFTNFICKDINKTFKSS